MSVLIRYLYFAATPLCLITLIMMGFFWIDNYKDLLKLEIKSNLYDIDEIKNAVIGNSSYYPWSVDVKEIRKKLLNIERFKEASVKISLPRTLYIRAIERKPYAVFWNYKEFFLVDADGVIISKALSLDTQKSHMIVSGQEALQNMEQVIRIHNDLSKITKVIMVRFVGKRRWDVILENGIQIKLPEKKPENALLLFEKIFKTQLISPNCIVDMRLTPDKIFIRKSI